MNQKMVFVFVFFSIGSILIKPIKSIKSKCKFTFPNMKQLNENHLLSNSSSTIIYLDDLLMTDGTECTICLMKSIFDDQLD